jgi:hypothetical protein
MMHTDLRHTAWNLVATLDGIESADDVQDLRF